MVFKGAGGRSARELNEAIEDVGGELNACTERDGTVLHRGGDGRACAARGRAASPTSSSARTSPPTTSSARKRWCCRSWRRSTTRPSDLIFDELWAASFGDQPLGRSILGDETSIRRGDAGRPARLARAAISRARLDPRRAPARFRTTSWSSLAERHLARPAPAARRGESSAARFTGGVRDRPRGERAGAY